MSNKSNYYYRSLPSGNADEFPIMEKNLHELKIPFEFATNKAGGRMYRFNKQHLRKLPKYEGQPFIPADREHKHGHGVYRMPNAIPDYFKWQGWSDWQNG